VELDAPKLVERWPTLARQLRDALTCDSEPGLASQVEELRVLEMCPCGDDFCQSFYTEPPPDEAYPSDRHRNWCPEDDDPGWEGSLILDVVSEGLAKRSRGLLRLGWLRRGVQ
jgi:hypothetical protein